MNVNPNNSVHVERLRRAVRSSWDRLEPFRKKQVEYQTMLAGSYYSDDGLQTPSPVNKIELIHNTYLRKCVANNPKALCTTVIRQKKPAVARFEVALNRKIDQMRLARTLRLAVSDAMFYMGIVMVGVTPTPEGTEDVFAEHIHLDDWVHDMDARRIDQCTFLGHRERVGRLEAMESGLFDNDTIERLTGISSGDNERNEDGNPRASSISSREQGPRGTRDDYIQYVNVWLPKDRLVVQMDVFDSGDVLRVVEWNGPPEGMYHILGFSWITSNTVPFGPIPSVVGLAKMNSDLYCKTARQAMSQKRIPCGPGEAAEDMQRAVDAQDTQYVRVERRDQIGELALGGVDNGTLAFTMHVDRLLSYMAGNIDVVGGLAQQAGTATQEKLLDTNSSERLSDMQEETINWTRNLVRAIGWYIWTDPRTVYETPIPVTPEVTLPGTFGPEDRAGVFDGYVDIEPYSMQPQTPARRLETLMQVWQGVILPILPIMQAQGIIPNVETLLKLLARYSNFSDIDELVTMLGQPINQPTQAEDARTGGAANAQAIKPAQTTRRYERYSGGGGQRAQDSMMMQALMSAGDNNNNGRQ